MEYVLCARLLGQPTLLGAALLLADSRLGIFVSTAEASGLEPAREGQPDYQSIRSTGSQCLHPAMHSPGSAPHHGGVAHVHADWVRWRPWPRVDHQTFYY